MSRSRNVARTFEFLSVFGAAKKIQAKYLTKAEWIMLKRAQVVL